MLYWIFGAVAAVSLLILLIAYLCFRIGFYVPPRKEETGNEIPLPEGEIYEPYWDKIRTWVTETRAMPREAVEITSFDGLKLRGMYYEFAPGAPIEIMFHGYRGGAERDLPSGVQRSFAVGRSALVVDQRCSGKSEGNVISFGINEHRDCLSWVDFVCKRFGPEVKIILTGLSMGAATVVMAGGTALPPNVIGILADCGYNAPRDIIKKVLPQMGIPAGLGYPFVKLGAKLFGHFDLEETSPEEAVKRCKVPVIFFHGESDDYVPCYMSRIVYDACPTRKALCTIPGAGHGLSYAVDPEKYVTTLYDFFGPEGSHPSVHQSCKKTG